MSIGDNLHLILALSLHRAPPRVLNDTSTAPLSDCQLASLSILDLQIYNNGAAAMNASISLLLMLTLVGPLVEERAIRVAMIGAPHPWVCLLDISWLGSP